LGPLFGAIAVLASQVTEKILFGKAFDLIGLIRLTPMIFAAVYFGLHSRKKFNYSAVIPLIAMAFFVLHPVGSQVWFFSLYWLIPLIATFSKRLFVRSLGSTFTAHAIGSTAFLYSIPTTPELWLTLIPVVALERFAFAIGISVSFIAFTSVLAMLENYIPTKVISIDKRYTIRNVLSF
jgi:hypothetical protein